MKFEININKEPTRCYLYRSYESMLTFAYNKLHEWIHDKGEDDTVVSVYDKEHDKTFYFNKWSLVF